MLVIEKAQREGAAIRGLLQEGERDVARARIGLEIVGIAHAEADRSVDRDRSAWEAVGGSASHRCRKKRPSRRGVLEIPGSRLQIRRAEMGEVEQPGSRKQLCREGSRIVGVAGYRPATPHRLARLRR